MSPVFVVGVFRSGTSLFYSLLNQHPQIALMYECDVWDFPAPFSGWRFSGDWLARQEFYNQALSRHRLTFGEKLRGLENIRTPDDLYRCHSENQGAAVWGEKSPVYSARLRRIAARYPNASFILIWRDPVEVYRSVRKAAEGSAFFARRGMLHRIIHHQERMIEDAARIGNAGARVFHVTYDRLVDDTAEVCREVCDFLKIDFNPQMAELERADFSAIYSEPQHDFLKRRVIERRRLNNDLVAPEAAAKLARYRKRWERLARQPLSARNLPPEVTEPSFGELHVERCAGAALHIFDDIKRLSFEFLPLPWLRTYRLFRNWLAAQDGSPREVSLAREFRQNSVTVLASFLVLALVAWIDYATGPELSCGPLYLLPCAALALIVGRNWATLGAIASASSVTCFREGQTHHFHAWLSMLVVWNLAMRFIFFEIFVLLLARIRRELVPRSSPAHNGSSKEVHADLMANGK